jgi:Ca-activated chloride channel family protein
MFRRVLGVALALIGSAWPGLASAGASIAVDARASQAVIAPGKSDRTFLRLALKGLPAPKRDARSPLNVSLVIDRSGSMAGERMERAKEAASIVLQRLAPDDIVSVVVYDHEVDVLVPPGRMREQEALLSRIRALTPRGRTALYDGTAKGLELVESKLSPSYINRVVLLSDGLANVGPSSPSELEVLGRKAGARGVSISTIGLGLGYNEDLMTRLALASDGNHAFARRPSDLLRIFDNEFGDAFGAVAQDIVIEIRIREGCRPVRVLGRLADISGNVVKLHMSQLAAEQEKYVIVELETPSAAPGSESSLADVVVRYQDALAGKRVENSSTVKVKVGASEAEARASVDKDVMASVAVQISTENSEAAVKLRDEGKVQDARKQLEYNAGYVKSIREQLSLPAAAPMQRKLEEIEARNRADADAVTAREWHAIRKSMRETQYKGKVQQSY